jgi:hypothetical protein
MNCSGRSRRVIAEYKRVCAYCCMNSGPVPALRDRPHLFSSDLSNGNKPNRCREQNRVSVAGEIGRTRQLDTFEPEVASYGRAECAGLRLGVSSC